MADGRETRAAIDTETVKGLLLINGGGAVALLAFLTGVLQKPELAPLARAIMWAVLTFQFGLVFALVHNRLRRLCSLEYSKGKNERVPCSIFSRALREPCVCHWSIAFMWASIVANLIAGIIVLVAGLTVIRIAPASQLASPEASPKTTLQGALSDKASQHTELAR